MTSWLGLFGTCKKSDTRASTSRLLPCRLSHLSQSYHTKNNNKKENINIHNHDSHTNNNNKKENINIHNHDNHANNNNKKETMNINKIMLIGLLAFRGQGPCGRTADGIRSAKLPDAAVKTRTLNPKPQSRRRCPTASKCAQARYHEVAPVAAADMSNLNSLQLHHMKEMQLRSCRALIFLGDYHLDDTWDARGNSRSNKADST